MSQTVINNSDSGLTVRTALNAMFAELYALGGGLGNGDKGDITVGGSGATLTIDNSAVTLPKIANIANNRVLGNISGGAAAPSELTAANLKTLLALTASDVSGLATIATSGSASDLGAGTVPAARMPALTGGDVTSSAGSVALTIPNDTVTYAKMQNVTATARILGRNTAGAGDIEELAVGTVNSMLGITALAVSANGSDLVANSVSDTKLRQSAGLSIIGRSANTTGNVADITGTANGVLRVSGTTLAFGAVDLATAMVTGDLPFANLAQGSALSVLGVTGNAGADVASIAAGSDGQILRRAGTALAFGSIDLSLSAAVGTTRLALANIVAPSSTNRLLGRGTSAGDWQEIIVGSGLTMTGSTLSSSGGGGVADGDKGDITVSGSGATWTIDADAVTYGKIQNVSATDRLLGRSTAGAGDIEEITCTAAGRAILDDANAGAQRTTLGLGTAALLNAVVASTAPSSPAVNDLWIDIS